MSRLFGKRHSIPDKNNARIGTHQHLRHAFFGRRVFVPPGHDIAPQTRQVINDSLGQILQSLQLTRPQSALLVKISRFELSFQGGPYFRCAISVALVMMPW